MSHALWAALLAASMFVGMLLSLEAGRRLGARRLACDPDGARLGLSAVDGAVFGLLGLLIAFTFSGAAARFDGRRSLIIEEANDIGTAYLRLDLLPADARAALQESFRKYVEARLEVYRKLPDLDAARDALARSTKLQGEIWAGAVVACRDPSPPSATMLLLPALNAMIDITNTRTAAGEIHPPAIIFWLLFGLALDCSVLAGYAMAGGKERSWTHMIGFAAMMALAVYVILDLEYPRLGLIRVDHLDQLLVDVRASMK